MMDHESGQPHVMHMTPGFDSDDRPQTATAGVERNAANAQLAGGESRNRTALGGLAISEMPRGRMDEGASSTHERGAMPATNANDGMPAGAMETDGAAGVHDTPEGMPSGAMRGVGMFSGGSGGMPSGDMTGAPDPGDALAASRTGPGADGMPSGDMTGEPAANSDPSTSDAGAQGSAFTLTGRWRLTISSITS